MTLDERAYLTVDRDGGSWLAGILTGVLVAGSALIGATVAVAGLRVGGVAWRRRNGKRVAR